MKNIKKQYFLKRHKPNGSIKISILILTFFFFLYSIIFLIDLIEENQSEKTLLKKYKTYLKRI